MEHTYSARTVVLKDASGHEVFGNLWDAGRSSGVVIVHGFVCWRGIDELDQTARALLERHDVLSIDVRGHGDDSSRFTWGREEWKQVEAAARFLAETGRRVAMIGFSFGGYHAARAAAKGAPCERLILVGSPVDLWVLDHFLLGSGFWRSLPAMLLRRRRRFRLGALPPSGQRALAEEELSRITARTLVVRGEDDWLISRRHAETYASKIPGATLHEIPRGYHAEHLLHSSREEFLGVVRGFLLD